MFPGKQLCCTATPEPRDRKGDLRVVQDLKAIPFSEREVIKGSGFVVIQGHIILSDTCRQEREMQ